MRAVLVIALVGCGRVGFSLQDRSATDADSQVDDAPGDVVAPIDCKVITFDEDLPESISITGQVDVMNGVFRALTPGSPPGVQSYLTMPSQSMVGVSTAVRLVDRPASPHTFGVGWHGTPFDVHFYGRGNQLLLDTMGTVTGPFDPDVHRWLRLRESGGDVIAETSTDGVNFDEFRVVTGFDVSDARFDLGMVSSDQATPPDVATFDDLTLCPSSAAVGWE